MDRQQEITAKIQEWTQNCGASFTKKLIATYLRDASQRLADIRQAHTDSNQELLTRSAHTIKSSSAQVGAMAVSGLAKDIELASRAGKFAEAGAALPALDAEFAAAQQVLETINPAT